PGITVGIKVSCMQVNAATTNIAARDNPPIKTANGKDGTTGKDHLAKMPQARSVVGPRQVSIGRKGKGAQMV
ncbi:hypothetical protein B296_00058669, partial [Ensete ventricosum]